MLRQYPNVGNCLDGAKPWPWCGVSNFGKQGPLGRDPIAVRIGTATFGLRRREARAILVIPGDGTPA